MAGPWVKVTLASDTGGATETWVNIAQVTRMVEANGKTTLYFTGVVGAANHFMHDKMTVTESLKEIAEQMISDHPIQHDNKKAVAGTIGRAMSGR